MHPNIKCCICVCHNYISIEYLFLSFNKNWYPEVIITNSYFLTDFILRSEVSTVKPSSKFENWANFAYATMNWDIADDLDCNIKLFADDTSLYVIVDEQNYIQAADMLSTDLSHIHSWSQNWAIKFNPNKTESIWFTRRNINNPPVYFGDMDNRVTDVNTHCHLGLDLQSNCKWGDYVSKIY
jgi:hypothetical protein